LVFFFFAGDFMCDASEPFVVVEFSSWSDVDS
jgi:hypothetical protein